MHRLMLDTLVASLLAFSVDDVVPSSMNTSLPILMWVLFIGVTAASDRTQRTYFLMRLQEVTLISGIMDLQHFVGILGNVMWSEKYYEKYCSDIWEEIIAPLII
jgi:hypothetical protein